jgi:hypothetical protein
MNILKRKDTTMQTFTKQVAPPATLVFANRRPSYSEAKTLCRGRVSSYKGYEDLRRDYPQYNLPCQPSIYYKKDWTSIYDFLGTSPSPRGEGLRKYWSDVKSGVLTRAVRQKQKNTQKYKINSTPTLQDKKMFLELAKALGVSEQIKPAYKILFTWDELLDLATL